jgi:hypothetical protein
MLKISKSLLVGALFSLALIVPSLGLVPVFADSGHAPLAQSSGQLVWSTANAPTLTKSNTWAGYGIVAPNAGVTAIRDSFKQPVVKCNSGSASEQAVAFLAGLDGAISADFEIVGTAAICPMGAASPTYAEIASAVMSPVLPIVPGRTYLETIVASGGVFHYALKDVTTGMTSKGASAGPTVVTAAECIVDKAANAGGPLPLAKFGTVAFGQDYTQVKNTCFATYNGITKAIGAFSITVVVIQYVMYNTALTTVDAATSPLTPDKSSFKVTFVHAGP